MSDPESRRGTSDAQRASSAETASSAASFGASRAAAPSGAPRAADGGFLDPWADDVGHDGGLRAFLRWRWQRLRHGLEPDSPPEAFAPATPRLVDRTVRGELRLTWIGHSTYLIQLAGLNILTDPVWSRRVSPVSWAGPARVADPGVAFDALPPIDVVLLSHDHFDHLDRPTVRRLHARFGDALRWITPLGFAPWLARLGIEPAFEGDWWQSAAVATSSTSTTTPTSASSSALQVTTLPARHWSRRSLLGGNRRLWASFALEHAGIRLYYGGDSAYADHFATIGQRLAPFDATLLPVGAYAPRWFMRPAHMDPTEAVRAYRDLGGQGLFAGMHYGTFRLSDEPVLEPAARTREAWHAAGLPDEQLWLPRHGETRILEVSP